MLGKRKVFLWVQADDNWEKHVICRLMYSNKQNYMEIQLYINSPEGYVTSMTLLNH